MNSFPEYPTKSLLELVIQHLEHQKHKRQENLVDK